MMVDEKVSVIVPIYNSENYLRKCLNSIVEQSYRCLEILLVDDGSTDGSGSICDEYCDKYDNVNVIHQANVGLTRTRGIGVEHSTGKYIFFVDSDDYIDSDLIKNLMSCMSADVDMVTSYLLFENEKEIKYGEKRIDDGLYEKRNILDRLIHNDIFGGTGFPVSMCGKIFLREPLVSVYSSVTERFDYGEDLITLLLYVKAIRNVYFVSEWGYHYVTRSGSMSTSFSTDYFVEIKRLYDYVKKLFDSDNEYVDIYINQASYFIGFLLFESIENIFPTISIGRIEFVPPYELIPQDCKLAVYGMGKVGHSFLKCLVQSKYANVVSVYDRNKNGSEYGYEIKPVENVVIDNFDYILIALSSESLARSVSEELIGYGVPIEKILWKKPYEG